MSKPNCPDCQSENIEKVAFTYRSNINGVNEKNSGPINNVYKCQNCEKEFKVPFTPRKVLDGPIPISEGVYVLPIKRVT